jgi:hypothetical protein
MIESCQEPKPRALSMPAVEVSDDAFIVDAALIGELLDLPAKDVQALMREGRITSTCERGVDEHKGEFRLTFFYRNRRARLSTDLAGRILRRSVIDFADRPVPGAQHQAGS